MKTIVQIVNIFLISTTIFWLHSCEKPKSEPISCTNNTMPLPQMAKDYFLFKNGTYWVYQNTITQQQDSFYVTDFVDWTGNNNQFRYGNELKKCYEVYRYSINGNLIGKMQCAIWPHEPKNTTNFINQTFFYSENNALSRHLYYKSTFIGDSLMLSGSVLAYTISIIDTIVINNSTYQKIISFKNTNLGIDYTKESYYAKNIGLIKFITNDNQTYELIKYHINQ